MTSYLLRDVVLECVRRLSVRLLAWVLLAWVLMGAGTGAARAQSPQLGAGPSGPVSGLQLIGDANQLYLVLIQTLPDPANPSNTLEASTVFARAAGASNWTVVSTVVGLTTDLAIWRNQLVLLRPDGSWRSVYPGSSSAGISPTMGLLIRVASDGTSLFALQVNEGTLSLLHLRAGNWAEVGSVPVPEGVSRLETSHVELAIQDQRATVAFLTDGGELVVSRSSEFPPAEAAATRGGPTTLPAEPSALTWERSPAFAPVQPAVTLRLFSLGERLGLWADPGTTTAGDLYLLPESPSDAAYSPRPGSFPLGEDNGEAAVSGNRVRFFYDPADDTEPTDAPNTGEPRIMERVFDFSGKPLGEPVELDLPTGIGMEERLGVLAAAVVFGGLFLAVLMSWRRRTETPLPVLEAAFSLPLASRTKRLMAGIIDASPFVLATGYLMATHPDTEAFTMNPRYLFIELVAAAAVITHTMICEVISGRTLGKMIFGLRVSDLSGERATPSRIVLRNLFKAIDLILLLPLVSILISPLRQSIGDSASGTLVLEQSPLPPSEPTE